jgi:uncharacterized cupredoxin-like copper-binding protein
MRSISRSVFAALIAVLAMGVVGSASASAAECHGATKKVTALCVTEEAQFGRFELKATHTPATNITLSVSGGLTIACSGVSSTGSFNATKEALAAEKLIAKLTGCEVPAFKASCEVDNGQITSRAIQGAFTGTTSIKLTAEKEILAYVTVKSTAGHTCGVAVENAPLTGTQTCELPNSTTEAVAHKMSCNVTGSNLKWLGKTATLEVSQEVKLAAPLTEKAWSLAYQS